MAASQPPSLIVNGDGTFGDNVDHRSYSQSSSSSSMNGLSPSIVIIILILTTTLIVSVALCLLLRHLNRRCIRHLSTASNSSSTAASVAAADSLRHSSRRVSPEAPAPFSVLIESLPIFTFSSVTHRAPSTINGGDCAVCLSKFEPHDQLRLLPLCCHAFHVGCIDTWLQTNQTCPLCRSAIHASDSDLMKATLASSNDGGSNSFRLQIGSLSRRLQAASTDFGEPRISSYSVGSFDYIVQEESEVSVNQTHQRTASDKDDNGGESPQTAALERNLAADVGAGRSWLQDYVDRLSSFSSRALSFRSSGRFFTGSSGRSEAAVVGEHDLEANRVGEEISEMFRWFSGV